MLGVRPLLLSALASLTFAQFTNYPAGLTVTFAPGGGPCATLNDSSDAGVSFYVDPSQYGGSGVCLNLRDMFSARNATQTGSVNNSQVVNETRALPGGGTYELYSLNWTSYNGNHYDPNINYTNIWYYQRNQTGSAFGSGAYGQFKFNTYAFENCTFAPPEISYRYTCQSSDVGECDVFSQGVRSISINAINQSDDSCYIFERYPSSAGLTMSNARLLLVVAGMLMAWMAVL